jgi:peptidoglycan/xylan/chitin deacetylase (PgdA/CDA1 family)
MDETRRRLPAMRWIIIALIAVALVLGLVIGGWTISRSRTFQLFGELVHRVETDEKVVALTFDDGPTPDYTPGVLAILKEKGVRATFFLIGQDAEANPAETRAIAADGHELGNHTYTHPDMTLASEGDAEMQVTKTDAAIRAAGYSDDIHFRPPFGKKLFGLPLYLAKNDRTTVTWDIEPESDENIAADPRRIISHVVEQTKPGSIVILHVMYPARKTSRQALPGLIDALKARGFRFVTVSELLAMRTP